MVRLLLCNFSLSPLSPPPPPPPKPVFVLLPIRLSISASKSDYSPRTPSISQALSSTLISLALSLGIFCASPLHSTALEPVAPQQELICREYDDYADDKSTGEVVTNEEIVEEAWQIVNDSFLETGRHSWSPDSWLKKKEDVLGGSIQSRSRAHDIIRRMLASLGDPYTRFLPPTDFAKMARYDMSGIGINLREIPEENGMVRLRVIGLLLDGPAHTAGIRQGDELLAINGMDVKGKSAFEASSMLQGPSETFVDVTVKHGNCGPVQSVKVQRQSVAKSPVFYRLEQVNNGPSSVGYVRLKEFNALARKDLVTAMRRLQDMGASYFVLDLRDNLGGLVQAGIEIAKLFLDKGQTLERRSDILLRDCLVPGFMERKMVLVGKTMTALFSVSIFLVTYTVGRDPLSVNNIVAESSPLFSEPVIVLVNKNTASASEIVATALHDNCKAVLVGERTYGKGLIQSVFELNDGSGVVVTIGKYVTPNHMDINGNGVDPDFRNFPAWNEVARYLSACHKPQEG